LTVIEGFFCRSALASKKIALPFKLLHGLIALCGIEPDESAYFYKRQNPAAHQVCYGADIAPIVLSHFRLNPPRAWRLFVGFLFICSVDHISQATSCLNDKRANKGNSYKTGNFVPQY